MRAACERQKDSERENENDNEVRVRQTGEEMRKKWRSVKARVSVCGCKTKGTCWMMSTGTLLSVIFGHVRIIMLGEA